jgi:hypothetical protein
MAAWNEFCRDRSTTSLYKKRPGVSKSELAMGFYLGGIFGGPELEGSPVWVISGHLLRARDANQEQLVPKDDGELDIVFQYPGSLSKPTFTGLRTGSFSRKQKIVQIQIAVPIEMMEPDVFGQFYVDAIEKAVRLGKKYFDRKGISFSEDKHLALVKKLREALGHLQNSQPETDLPKV